MKVLNFSAPSSPKILVTNFSAPSAILYPKSTKVANKSNRPPARPVIPAPNLSNLWNGSKAAACAACWLMHHAQLVILQLRPGVKLVLLLLRIARFRHRRGARRALRNPPRLGAARREAARRDGRFPLLRPPAEVYADEGMAAGGADVCARDACLPAT